MDPWYWYIIKSSGGTPLITRRYHSGSIWLSYRKPGTITGGLFGRHGDRYGTTEREDYDPI